MRFAIASPSPALPSREPAAFLDAIEAVEDARQLVAAECRCRCRRLRRRLSPRPARPSTRDRAAALGVAQRVLDEVAQHALDQPDVAEHERQVGPHRRRAARCLCCAAASSNSCTTSCTRSPSANGSGVDDGLAGIELREIEQAPDEPAQLLGLLERGLEIGALLLRARARRASDAASRDSPAATRAACADRARCWRRARGASRRSAAAPPSGRGCGPPCG